MRALSELRGAISFLTVIPVGGGIEEAVRGVYWFPAVGAMVGLIAGLASTATASALPGLMVGVVGVAVTLLLTGLHHLDGLVDLGDGLMAHGPPEVRLKAMRDSRMGAGGFALALMVTLASIASIASAPTSALVPILVVSEASAKLSMVLLMEVSRPLGGGVGSTFIEATQEPSWPLRLAAATTACSALAVALAGVAGAIAVMAVASLSAFMSWASERALGGATGDVFGALNELSRAVSLAILAAMWGEGLADGCGHGWW